MNIETKTYSDGTTATGPAPLPMQSPTVPTEAQLLGMVEDYGQWLWDCGYFDEPTGETLVDEAAFKRQEIKAALNAALIEAYAEGRKDEAEEHAWQPIETAPTNVEVVALFRGKLPVIACKRADGNSPSGWCHSEAANAFAEPNRGLTHWMPLPKHPEAQ